MPKPIRKPKPVPRLTPAKATPTRNVQREVTTLLQTALNSLLGYDRLLRNVRTADPRSMELIRSVRAAVITDCARIERALKPGKGDKARRANGGLMGLFAYLRDR